MAQTVKSKSPHSDAHRQLLANQAKNKDQIRLVEKNTFIDLIDDIEPEPDIYTEGWNSKSVLSRSLSPRRGASSAVLQGP